MSGPLTGLRVVELGGIGPVPFAGIMLADAGAEVTAIVRAAPAADGPVDGMTEAVGGVLTRGRREVTLNLKDPADRDVALTMVAKADAALEGFRPGALERLGLGPDVLLARNPALVLGRMTGWGQDGPLAQAPGHDINYLALSGLLAHLGGPDQPRPPMNLLGDFGGASMLAFGVLAGIISARSTGRGTVVDAAMLDGAALLGTMTFELWNRGAWNPDRGRNVNDGGAPFYRTYLTSDQKWVAVGSMESVFWDRLLAGLRLDPAALPDQWDRERWPELCDVLAAVFVTRTRDEWAADLADACVSPVLTIDEAPSHPHNQARHLFVPGVDGPVPAPAPRFP